MGTISSCACRWGLLCPGRQALAGLEPQQDVPCAGEAALLVEQAAETGLEDDGVDLGGFGGNSKRAPGKTWMSCPGRGCGPERVTAPAFRRSGNRAAAEAKLDGAAARRSAERRVKGLHPFNHIVIITAAAHGGAARTPQIRVSLCAGSPLALEASASVCTGPYSC